MKKDNTILLIVGLAAVGAGYYFYMKSKTPVRKGYTITVPPPTKITASQYYAQTQQPTPGPSLLNTVLSIFKKPTTATTADKRTVEQMRADFYAASGGMGAAQTEISNFF